MVVVGDVAAEDVAAIISQYDVGTIMTFTIYRDGETLQVDVTLMETSDIY